MATKTKKTVKSLKEFNYKSIKTFEDACKQLGLDPAALPDMTNVPEEFKKPLIAGYKLMIIYKAINNGWRPDWNNYSQGKYYPWFRVLSSGFGFSGTTYYCASTYSHVGSRLCTETSDKALYIAKQFEDLYKDYFLYTE